MFGEREANIETVTGASLDAVVIRVGVCFHPLYSVASQPFFPFRFLDKTGASRYTRQVSNLCSALVDCCRFAECVPQLLFSMDSRLV